MVSPTSKPAWSAGLPDTTLVTFAKAGPAVRVASSRRIARGAVAAIVVYAGGEVK